MIRTARRGERFAPAFAVPAAAVILVAGLSATVYTLSTADAAARVMTAPQADLPQQTEPPKQLDPPKQTEPPQSTDPVQPPVRCSRQVRVLKELQFWNPKSDFRNEFCRSFIRAANLKFGMWIREQHRLCCELMRHTPTALIFVMT